MIRYELPYPPSTNHLFASFGNRRVKSTHYNAWRKQAELAILEQGRRRLTGPIALHIALVRPDKRRRDLTNAAFKAVEDVLVEMGVIDDDSLVQRVSAEWVQSGPACVVLIQEAEDGALAA